MKSTSKALWLLAAALPLSAQTHRVSKTETVVRAVGVYEWTGDLAKPNASRLIPVTLYIDRKIEDAGVYLARPVPFALETGNIFELDQAGVPKGNIDLLFARHLQASTAQEAYDDGWFGYGTFQPPSKPAPVHKLNPSKTLAVITTSKDDDAKPHFSKKTEDPSAEARSASKTSAEISPQADDPDRPTMKRRSDDTSAQTTPTPAPADDPDRPTMKRRSDDTSTTAKQSPAPADDPDRPTLKRHTPEDAKKAKNDSGASVTSVGSLNDDPDRPNLHRGRSVHMLTADDLPKLSGLPVDLQQMVAVSDAANRSVHDFAHPWENDAERSAVLLKMEATAKAQLAEYGTSAPLLAVAPTAGKPSPAGRSLPRQSKPPIKLVDEQLKSFQLSYGDVPTFVYQARTDGEGANLRYITLVAQRDAQGEPAIVLHVVTDATHLDRTPRLRLVDAVDVEASNRASLLFEARGQSSRQFAVYRVLGQQAEQIFATGTMQ